LRHPSVPLADSRIEQLSWLVGHWRGEVKGQPIEECWFAPAGGAMCGMFRWLKDPDTVRFYELMVLESVPGAGIVLRIKHFHPGLIGWEEKYQSADFPLVRLTDREAVFARRNDAKPLLWLVYRREGDADLVVYFDNGSDEPDPAAFFRYAAATAVQ